MHPVDIAVTPQFAPRNRVTGAFRPILALPHIVLVGAPAGFALSLIVGPDDRGGEISATGALGIAAGVVAIVAWFAILFTGTYPTGLYDFAVYYLRWRVRAVAYTALLRDEYPPFGEGAYEASLWLSRPVEPRNKVSVGFRLMLALPHIVVVALLSLAWAVSTIVAWLWIILGGEYPVGLYNFGVGALRWTTRVEAYLLLLHDEYPPFSLD